jgi:hypothetical protein
MSNSTKPDLNPTEVAFKLWQFLEWADQSELDALFLDLAELAGQHCPQGSAIKIGNLAEASAMIAFGAMKQSALEIEDAEERFANTRRPGLKEVLVRPDADDERDEARSDIGTARYLHRILAKHKKRADATASDILTRIPN